MKCAKVCDHIEDCSDGSDENYDFHPETCPERCADKKYFVQYASNEIKRFKFPPHGKFYANLAYCWFHIKSKNKNQTIALTITNIDIEASHGMCFDHLMIGD